MHGISIDEMEGARQITSAQSHRNVAKQMSRVVNVYWKLNTKIPPRNSVIPFGLLAIYMCHCIACSSI